MSKGKKKGGEDKLVKAIVLATAILNLIIAIVKLINELL